MQLTLMMRLPIMMGYRSVCAPETHAEAGFNKLNNSATSGYYHWARRKTGFQILLRRSKTSIPSPPSNAELGSGT